MRPRWGLAAGGVLAAGFSVIVLLGLLIGAHGVGVGGYDEDRAEESTAQGDSAPEDAVEQTPGRPEIDLGVEKEPTLGFLGDGQVVVVKMSGFESNSSGRLAQCRRRGSAMSECTNGFPVRFDDAGAARIQYAVEAPGSDAPCSPSALCVLAVSGGGHSATGFLGFGGPATVPLRVARPVLADQAALVPKPSAEYD